MRQDLAYLWTYWEHWKAGVRPDERSPEGALVRTFVSSAAALLGKVSPHPEAPDGVLVTLLEQIQGETAGRVAALCAAPRVVDGRFAVYQGIRGAPAETMRASLAASRDFVVSANRPWSFAGTRELVIAHARRARRGDADAAVPGLIYRAWIDPAEVIFADDLDDEFPVDNLDQELELVVWFGNDRRVPVADVVEREVRRAPPT